MRAYAPNEEVFAASIPPYTAEGKGQMVYNLAEFNAVKFCLCICDFWGTITYDIMAELLTRITGEEWTSEEMGEVGRRVLNIGRAFNQREGFNRSHDTVPKRIINDALGRRRSCGRAEDSAGGRSMICLISTTRSWDGDENGMMPEDLIQSIL